MNTPRLLLIGSTPVFTVLCKSVTFFIINTFLIIKVEILSELLGNPGKRPLRSKNPEKFMRDPPPNPARSLRLRRSFRTSVSIYSTSAPSRPSTVVSFFKCLGSCASQNNSKCNEFSIASPEDLHFVLFSLPYRISSDLHI